MKAIKSIPLPLEQQIATIEMRTWVALHHPWHRGRDDAVQQQLSPKMIEVLHVHVRIIVNLKLL